MTNYLVQPRPILRFLTATFSLVLIVAWFVAANHCLLAAVPPASAVSSHCSGHSTPEKQENGGCADKNCCKALSTPASVLTKNLVDGQNLAFAATDFPAALPALESEPQVQVVTALDTGPPRGNWFAQAILQHSLLAHAPPVFV